MSKRKRRPKKQKFVRVPETTTRASPASRPMKKTSLTRGSRNIYLWAVLIFIIALGLRLTVIAQVRGADPFVDDLLVDGDERSFEMWATRIAEGDYLGPDGNFIQAPLYPYILGGLFKVVGYELYYARVVQAGFDAATAILVFLLAHQLFSPSVARLAGLLYAVNRIPLFYVTRILRDTPMPFFVILTLVVLVHAWSRRSWGWWLAGGMACGLAHLCRENFILVSIAFILLLVVNRRLRADWPRVVVPFIVGIALMMTPVFLRNVAVGASPWQVTENGQVALVMGNAADASGVGYVVPASNARITSENNGLLATLTATLATHADEPFGFIALYLRKLHALFGHLEIANNANFYVARNYSALLAFPLLPDFGSVVPLACLGMIAALRRKRPLPALFPPVLLGAYTIGLLLVFILSRFRLPLLPVMTIYAAFMLLELGRAVKTRQTRFLVINGVVLALLYLVVFYPTAYEREFGDVSYREYYIRGYQLLDQGEVQAGRQLLEKSVEIKPDYAVALNKLAILTLTDGDTAASLQFLQRATSAAPSFLEIWVNLGTVAFQAGETRQARFAYQHVVTLQPDNLQFRHELANLWLLEENYPAAELEYEQIVARDPDDELAVSQLVALRHRNAAMGNRG